MDSGLVWGNSPSVPLMITKKQICLGLSNFNDYIPTLLESSSLIPGLIMNTGSLWCNITFLIFLLKQFPFPECADNPCENGGTCLELLSGYMCNCPPGFTRRKCESVTTEVEISTIGLRRRHRKVRQHSALQHLLRVRIYYHSHVNI